MKKLMAIILLTAGSVLAATNTLLMTGSTVLRPAANEPLTWSNTNTFAAPIICSTQFLYYATATNWVGIWADWQTVYMGSQSNDSFVVLTNSIR